MTEGPTLLVRRVASQGKAWIVMPRGGSDDASRPIAHRKSPVQKLPPELCHSESAWPAPSGFGLRGNSWRIGTEVVSSAARLVR